jgi:dTDP-4-dehydrorhamnose 3,5-epimerase-like enzyme
MEKMALVSIGFKRSKVHFSKKFSYTNTNKVFEGCYTQSVPNTVRGHVYHVNLTVSDLYLKLYLEVSVRIRKIRFYSYTYLHTYNNQHSPHIVLLVRGKFVYGSDIP